MPFVKGQSGNPSGKRRGSQLDEELNVTVRWLIARANDVRRLAVKERNLSAAVAAIRLIGEFAGHSRLRVADEEAAAAKALPIDRPPEESYEAYIARRNREMGMGSPDRSANGSH